MTTPFDYKSNVTRQKISQDPNNPKDHLDSGYENSPSVDFTIPAVGIEDIDIALHRLFDNTIGFNVMNISSVKGPQQVKKPFVIFATGERFALIKKLKPPRDRNKALILPAISIRRTSIEQTAADITSRGMSQFGGPIVIKRKLAPEDRDFQNLLNKQGIKNLQNVLSGLPTTTRETGALQTDPDVIEGGLLEPHLDSTNIYEVITVPPPQFFTANYEIIFWTNYTQHMAYMIQTYLASFLPQVRGHKLQTDKGYWFITYTDEAFTADENVSDFSGEERIIRYTFNVRVKGYLFAPQTPTGMVPIRRWISSPNIVFDMIAVGDEIQPKSVLEKPPIKDTAHEGFTLTDIDRDPQTAQTPTTLQRYAVKKTVIDPVTGKRRIKYVSILDTNQKKGETVYAASDVETLEQFILNPK